MSLVLGLVLEHSCPWPQECLSSERLSLALASDFFCVLGLGLEPCVLDSTSGNMVKKDIKLNSKPWIAKGLHTSSRTKNKHFRNYVKNSNQENKTNYKKYFNKLTHINNSPKRIYKSKRIIKIRPKHGKL